MIIKSEKGEIVPLFVVCLALLLVILFLEGMGTLFFLMFWVCLVGCGRYWLAFGKTFILEEEGCTVCFLWYRKEYRWDELQVKRYANYRPCIPLLKCYCKEGAEFSPKNLHRPRWLAAADYCEMFHPMSFFFIYFYPENMRSRSLMFYVVDGNEFREKMREWGVPMENEYDISWYQ